MPCWVLTPPPDSVGTPNLRPPTFSLDFFASPGSHTPYTLHHCSVPCTLYPMPSTLYPTPCTLYPTPHTLHSTPYTLCPMPYTLNPKPCNLYPVTSTLYPVPCTVHPLTYIGYHTSYTIYPLPCALCTLYPTLHNTHAAPYFLDPESEQR